MRPNLTLSPLVALFALAVASPAIAQNQTVLEKALEGREVMVLMDMPASHAGVDLYLQREPEIEFGEYARRLKAYGVSLRKEDRVMITTVKVNKKNIEIHLGGGGYGTWGDDSGYVSPTYVGKSKRESDLEKERRNTTDRRSAAPHRPGARVPAAGARARGAGEQARSRSPDRHQAA